MINCTPCNQSNRWNFPTLMIVYIYIYIYIYEMNTIFVNSKNNKTSDFYRLLLNLSDKINLKRSDKYVTLSNLCIYYNWKSIKKSYKNNKFKTSSPIWNKKIWIIQWIILRFRYSRLFWVNHQKTKQWLIILQ